MKHSNPLLVPNPLSKRSMSQIPCLSGRVHGSKRNPLQLLNLWRFTKMIWNFLQVCSITKRNRMVQTFLLSSMDGYTYILLFIAFHSGSQHSCNTFLSCCNRQCVILLTYVLPSFNNKCGCLNG